MNEMVTLEGIHFGIACDAVNIVKKDSSSYFEFTFYLGYKKVFYYAVELPATINTPHEALEEIKKIKYVNEGHSETF